MAYTAPRTWVAGDVLTAGQLNQHLRDQLLAAFPLAVDAWTSFTPTLTQGVAVTKTATYCKYMRVGRIIVAHAVMTVTGTGTAGSAIEAGLPVAAAVAGNFPIGTLAVSDASTAPFNYAGIAVPANVLYVRGITNGVAAYLGATGASFAAALAVGDLVSYQVTYEAAT